MSCLIQEVWQFLQALLGELILNDLVLSEQVCHDRELELNEAVIQVHANLKVLQLVSVRDPIQLGHDTDHDVLHEELFEPVTFWVQCEQCAKNWKESGEHLHS